MSVYTLSGFLSSEECASAISFFPPRAQARINDNVVRTSTRSSRASFLFPDTDEKRAFVEKIINVVKQVNAHFFRFDLSGHERLQLAEYDVGDGYDWHLDIGSGTSALRKLSASVQLSASEDYDGGDLELWKTPPVERTQGTLVIFPSYLVHRVAPVTRGLRRSLVVWTTGKTPYR